MQTIDVNHRRFLDKTNGFPKRDLGVAIADAIFPLGENGAASEKASVSHNHRIDAAPEEPGSP